MGQITVDKNVGGIEGLCVIKPAVHGDDRGYFMETYNEKDMKEAGIDIKFVQDNQSMSVKGVLRGFISRNSIRSANWCVRFVELFLMWQLIFGQIPRPMASGMGLLFLLRIRYSF